MRRIFILLGFIWAAFGVGNALLAFSIISTDSQLAPWDRSGYLSVVVVIFNAGVFIFPAMVIMALGWIGGKIPNLRGNEAMQSLKSLERDMDLVVTRLGNIESLLAADQGKRGIPGPGAADQGRRGIPGPGQI